jgi:hypothetical protein
MMLTFTPSTPVDMETKDCAYGDGWSCPITPPKIVSLSPSPLAKKHLKASGSRLDRVRSLEKVLTEQVYCSKVKPSF